MTYYFKVFKYTKPWE